MVKLMVMVMVKKVLMFVGAKGINIVFSFTCCNNFKLVDLDLELEFPLPHKYALVHH